MVPYKCCRDSWRAAAEAHGTYASIDKSWANFQFVPAAAWVRIVNCDFSWDNTRRKDKSRSRRASLSSFLFLTSNVRISAYCYHGAATPQFLFIHDSYRFGWKSSVILPSVRKFSLPRHSLFISCSSRAAVGAVFILLASQRAADSGKHHTSSNGPVSISTSSFRLEPAAWDRHCTNL